MIASLRLPRVLSSSKKHITARGSTIRTKPARTTVRQSEICSTVITTSAKPITRNTQYLQHSTKEPAEWSDFSAGVKDKKARSRRGAGAGRALSNRSRKACSPLFSPTPHGKQILLKYTNARLTLQIDARFLLLHNPPTVDKHCHRSNGIKSLPENAPPFKTKKRGEGEEFKKQTHSHNREVPMYHVSTGKIV